MFQGVTRMRPSSGTSVGELVCSRNQRLSSVASMRMTRSIGVVSVTVCSDLVLALPLVLLTRDDQLEFLAVLQPQIGVAHLRLRADQHQHGAVAGRSDVGRNERRLVGVSSEIQGERSGWPSMIGRSV